jgi:hypothetical protein
MKIARYFFFALVGVIYPWVIMGPFSASTGSVSVRLALFAALTLLGAVVLKPSRPSSTWGLSLAAAMLFYGLIYRLAAFLPDISTYPFSLGWSEASRYYYASLFLPEKLYGSWTQPSVLHPSRYLMQAVPFLAPGLPIWVHRAWQVFLWIVFPLATGLLLARRLSIQDGFKGAMFTAWAFLFLFQGPLYYHLLVMVVVVLWGFDRHRVGRTTFIILAASAWAGISRINWLPVPGMLAAALYFLESSVDEENWLRYLVKPALWTGLGTFLAFAVQVGYEHFSGNPPEYFGSSFTSDLLWYRLLPSVTYPVGVLPAALLVSIPLLLLILNRTVKRVPGKKGLSGFGLPYHPIRLLGLGAILFVLGVGGIVVSVKIGGGSNLHNIDAFLVLLLVTGSYITFGNFVRDGNSMGENWLPAGVLVSLAIVVPVALAVTQRSPLQPHDPTKASAAIEKLNQSFSQLTSDGGEVLLISERHLLTFNYLKTRPVIHKYEKVFLMEMAMAGSEAYFEDFYKDLGSQRYKLIVSDPLWPHYQGRSHPFGEENDAWVRWVVEPLLCTYKEWVTIPEVPVVLLVPNQESSSCLE